MSTEIPVHITHEGLLIPRSALQGLGEVEVVREKERILIQPRSLTVGERDRVLRILEAADMLLPPEPLPVSHRPVSDEERAELAQKFGLGRPLSEIVLEERQERI